MSEWLSNPPVEYLKGSCCYSSHGLGDHSVHVNISGRETPCDLLLRSYIVSLSKTMTTFAFSSRVCVPNTTLRSSLILGESVHSNYKLYSL